MRMKAEWKTARASAIENGDSTFMGRPCDRGHDGRRYLSGGCYDCTIARTDERRPGPKKNCPQPIGKTTPAHRQARAEAQAEGHTSYHGRACSICKLTERYTGNNSCLKCARDKAIRAYHGNLARAMFHRAKTRSKIEGWYFNLEQSDIVVPTHCPILGIELFASAIRDHAPSLDRIDNSKGYVKGNIQVISQRANRLKSDATIAEWELIGAYMKRNLATTSVSLD